MIPGFAVVGFDSDSGCFDFAAADFDSDCFGFGFGFGSDFGFDFDRLNVQKMTMFRTSMSPTLMNQNLRRQQTSPSILLQER